MISYVLGHAGEGKTSSSLRRFQSLTNAFFFGCFPERDQHAGIEPKAFDAFVPQGGVFDILPAYRKHLDAREEFNELMVAAVRNALHKQPEAIFLDEFQLYCSQGLADLVLSAEKAHFFLIHQFPKQLPDPLFSALSSRVEKWYLFNPYPPFVPMFTQRDAGNQ